jgi:DNA repair exonuclease SbcCD ATPase subunit
MKKLRPDLSEEEIMVLFCPDIENVHMLRRQRSCNNLYDPIKCRECWNREVDEEMVYFQDEAVEGVYKHNFKLACENFDSAMELVSKRDREIAELKEKVEYFKSARDSIVKEYEQSMINYSKLREKNENLKHALDDSLAERDSFRRENEFFKEKIRDLKQKAKELKSKSTPWRTNDGC